MPGNMLLARLVALLLLKRSTLFVIIIDVNMRLLA
jgi:hypothetical protein